MTSDLTSATSRACYPWTRRRERGGFRGVATSEDYLSSKLLLALLYLAVSTQAFLLPRALPPCQRPLLNFALAATKEGAAAPSWFGEDMWKSNDVTTAARTEFAPSSPSSSAPQYSTSPGRRRSSGKGGNKKEWERSAPEEFLLILTSLRAHYSGQQQQQQQQQQQGEEMEEEEEEVAKLSEDDDGEAEIDIGHVINLVRALANRQWEQAEESAALLCHSQLLDTVLSRMVVYAATQRNEPDLALEILGGMREKRIDVDAFMASLVAKAAATDRRWMPVIEVIRAQLSTNPGGSLTMPAVMKGRRHEGFTQALASTIERGKFYSSSFLVDALLQFRMVDLFTAKVAVKFYRFSRTPARGLPWIATARAIGLIPDADLDFEVGRMYKSLGMWREAVALLNEMVEKGRSVEDEHVGVVLSACHQAGEWGECMEVLERMHGWGLRVGRVSYLIVLRLLLEKRRLDQVRTVLGQMQKQGTPLDAETARLVLFTLAKRGPVYSSMEFLKLMPAWGVEPDLVTYTAVLRACARFQEPDRALEVLKIMEGKGMTVDVLACVTVMEALSGASRWDEAFGLFDSCRAGGLRPDIKCWTQVLHQATQAGRWDLFPTYLHAAVGEARTHQTGLDLRFFATVINACAEANRTDEALAVLASVRSYGLVPNVVCYSAAAKSCLARNRWRDALGLLEEANEQGIPTDATMYRTVLRCCWQARQWQSVLKLYGEMLERGLEVDGQMYTQLMDVLARAGQAELAADLLQEMVANGVIPVDRTLSAFFQCWYQKGEYEEAWRRVGRVARWEEEDEEEEDYEIMGTFAAGGAASGKRSNIQPLLQPGLGTFADLMNVCARREDWEEVLRLHERMKDMGLPTTAMRAPHLVARAYAEMGRWEEARRFLKEGIEGVASTDIAGAPAAGAAAGHSTMAWGKAYGALLTMCSKRIEPTRALNLLEEMEMREIAPDAEAYHAVMDACAQSGMEGEVRTVFEKMRGRGDIIPSVESFTIMLELCAREGEKGEEALRLMEDLEGLGLTPDMLCFNAAMEACREASLGERGKEGGRFRAAMRKWRDLEVMHTYNSEIAVLATRKGGFDDGASATALRYLKEMRDNGIPRDADSFNMALEACARAGDLAGVREVFAELQVERTAKEGVEVKPDIFSYITMANALVGEGQGVEAMALLNYLVGLASDDDGAGTVAAAAVGSTTTTMAAAGAANKEIKRGKGRVGPGKQSVSRTSKRIDKSFTSQTAPPSLPTSILTSPLPPSSANVGIRIKTRWPAYYRFLWPRTAKTLSKTIITLASSGPPSQQATRCADIGRLLQFLRTHVPIFNTQAVAEQLVGRGMCSTEHIKTLTGDALAVRWRKGAEQAEGNNRNAGWGLF